MTYQQYQNHDCHLSPEDGCEVCNEWFEQQDTGFDKDRGIIVKPIYFKRSLLKNWWNRIMYPLTWIKME